MRPRSLGVEQGRSGHASLPGQVAVSNISPGAEVRCRLMVDPLWVLRQSEKKHRDKWTQEEKQVFQIKFNQFFGNKNTLEKKDRKNFTKIASFLNNKSTADCVDFYYKSKRNVEYKSKKGTTKNYAEINE